MELFYTQRGYIQCLHSSSLMVKPAAQVLCRVKFSQLHLLWGQCGADRTHGSFDRVFSKEAYVEQMLRMNKWLLFVNLARNQRRLNVIVLFGVWWTVPVFISSVFLLCLSIYFSLNMFSASCYSSNSSIEKQNQYFGPHFH